MFLQTGQPDLVLVCIQASSVPDPGKKKKSGPDLGVQTAVGRDIDVQIERGV